MTLMVDGRMRGSLLLPQTWKPAEPRRLAAKPRQQRTSGKLRRHTGHGGGEGGGTPRAAPPSGQTPRGFLPQLLHLLRAPPAAPPPPHIGQPRHLPAPAPTPPPHHARHS